MIQTVLNLTNYVSELVWNERFWLPANVTWLDLQRDNTTFLPQPRDMFMPFPIGILLLLLRFLFERAIFQPLGTWYNIKDTPPKRAKPNGILEAAYKKSRRAPNKIDILDLSKKTDMTARQIERWWRLRRNQGKPSDMGKFRETSWRFVFYLSSFTYGIYILWSKPWFWDTLHCWYNYPRQHISDDVWWYYMIELGFYWSLLFSLCIDNKRKDFKEMMVHHFATIALMVFSWVCNFVRSGTLVLAVHDAVDYWLEGAKLAKYLGYSKLCDSLFVMFAIVWVLTRLIIYPLRVINTTMIESYTIIGMLPAYYVFNVLLCILQVLHVFWFFTIFHMLQQYIMKGQVEKDERSDTEAESDEEDDNKTASVSPLLNGHANGKKIVINNNM